MPESYRTLPRVARATGRSERTLQLWFAPHRAARTRAGYPLSLILNVLAEHDVAANAAQLAEGPHDARNAAQDAQEGGLGAAAGDSLAAAHRAEVAALRAHNDTLRAQLDARTREVSELHVLLGRAQRALPDVREDAAESGRDSPREARPQPWWAIWRRRHTD